MRNRVRNVALVTAASIFLTTLAGTSAQAQSRPDRAESAVAVQATSSEDSIRPVVQNGVVVGYTVDAKTRASLNLLTTELSKEAPVVSPRIGNGLVTTQGFFEVAQCVGAVAAFVALTVFPTARAAKLAVRIGKMVNKYGVKKVAQILTRTYKGSDINADAIAKEIALEAAGVGALGVCF